MRRGGAESTTFDLKIDDRQLKASYDQASLSDQNKCPLYGIAGCLLLRGFEYIEVYGSTIWTFRIVHYIAGVRR